MSTRPDHHADKRGSSIRKPRKIRLDEALIRAGYFNDADTALRAVLAHIVKVDDVYATSAAMLIKPDALIEVKGAKHFVSRGGFKLQAALDGFSQDVTGLTCIDIGSSTGGFSDCLLQAGARSVACVDVNYGQLDWTLRNNPRVTVFERTNIRTADPRSLGAPFDMLVADLSFIGLAGLAPTFASLCHEGSVLIALVKPQFESGHDETEAGVVVSEEVRARTVEEVCEALHAQGFNVTGTIESPIHGKKAGNVEYLVRAIYSMISDCDCNGDG